MTERGRDRKRRRRRSDDDEEPEGISSWKLGMVVAVIVVCFAMLYPSVFHPMLMGFLGRGQPAPAPAAHHPPVHPGMAGAGPRHGGGGRHHDHPAMRMAAAQADAQSGGKGMFTWMLPLYTVGVVVFLLYTLFKSKKKTKKSRSRYDTESSDDEEDYGKFAGKLGKKKLRGLQERLKQTEDAMSKILEQLETVQAAGVDIEGLEPLEDKDKDVADSEPKPVLSPESEQYIGDLETALKEFKVLSAEYEKEKDRHLVDEASEGTSDEELNSSEDSEESDSEERQREKRRAQRRREKEKKNKKRTKKVVEEESEEEEEEDENELEEKVEKGLEQEPEEKMVETVIPKKKEKEAVRRRAKKI